MKPTEAPSNTTAAAEQSSEPVSATGRKFGQFGMEALFWLTFAIGLGISYLRQLGSVEIVTDALVAIVMGAVVGVLIGQIGKLFNSQSTLSNAIFWATLIAAFGYISTAGDPRYARVHRLAWAMVGATTGGIAATVFKDRVVSPVLLMSNAILCAAVAGLLMGLFVFYARDNIRSADLQFDAYGAPFIGVAVALFVQLLMWLERQKYMPRYITATWLLAAVIVGNLISR